MQFVPASSIVHRHHLAVKVCEIRSQAQLVDSRAESDLHNDRLPDVETWF